MLQAIVEQLSRVPGVRAIVLGGSHALGFAHAKSDIDIGLYYRESSPFPIDDIRAIANSLSASAPPTVTGFYEWGQWVNGGAWIQSASGDMDFVYRSLDHVARVIEAGLRGEWAHDYDQQPPYGFRSVIYFAETQHSVILFDPEGEIARLKNRVAAYPEPLRERIVQESLWGAEFSLWAYRGFVQAGDVYSAAGCATRVAQFLVQAIFALNRKYFLSDKHALRMIDAFATLPPDFSKRLATSLAHPASQASLQSLTELWQDLVNLTAGSYRPRFQL